MKNLFSFLMFALLFLRICTGQSEPPAPPSIPKTETTNSFSNFKTTTINFNNGRNHKLKLRVDDTNFDLDLDFKNIKTASIRRLITKYLGNSKSSFFSGEEWSDNEKTYRIRLCKGSFEVSVNRDEWSENDYQDFLSFAGDVLDELGWDINVSKY